MGLDASEEALEELIAKVGPQGAAAAREAMSAIKGKVTDEIKGAKDKAVSGAMNRLGGLGGMLG